MTDSFQAFWDRWKSTVGRNVAKKAAERAYNAALKETTPEAIIERLERRYREEWALRKMEYRPYPATWIRSENWIEDERETELLIDEAPLFKDECHFHRCSICDPPHDWRHDDGGCWMSYDVICESALISHKQRVEAMRAK